MKLERTTTHLAGPRAAEGAWSCLDSGLRVFLDRPSASDAGARLTKSVDFAVIRLRHGVHLWDQTVQVSPSAVVSGHRSRGRRREERTESGREIPRPDAEAALAALVEGRAVYAAAAERGARLADLVDLAETAIRARRILETGQIPTPATR
ncbi:MAG: hypothetical protein QM779_08205 [Propionicimonas sp.]|uniref:hypothetical protein n=1 Tax=Propionicimonas sp. TaxID=1955623 RepID=UPI003D0C5C1C